MKILKDRYIVDYFYEKQLPNPKIKYQMHYKVKWSGYTLAESTYEPMDRLQEDNQQYFIDKFQKEYQYQIMDCLGPNFKRSELIEFDAKKKQSLDSSDGLQFDYASDSDLELQTDSSSEQYQTTKQQQQQQQQQQIVNCDDDIVDINETDSESQQSCPYFNQFICDQSHLLEQPLYLTKSTPSVEPDQPIKLIDHRYCKFTNQTIQPLEQQDVLRLRNANYLIECIVFKVQWRHRQPGYLRFKEIYYCYRELLFEYLKSDQQLMDYFVRLAKQGQQRIDKKVDDVVY